jgi:hypothetical protein
MTKSQKSRVFAIISDPDIVRKKPKKKGAI